MDLANEMGKRRSLKKAKRQLRGMLRTALPLPLYCKAVNALNWRNRIPYRLFPHEETELYAVRSGEEMIVVCRRQRHHRYENGIGVHIERLAREYGLNEARIEPNGVFLDCGANVGEMGFWAREKGMNYVAFEPEPLEARCIDLNHFGGQAKTRRVALWHRRETLQLYSKPETADSSVIDMGTARESRSVEALPLDEVKIDFSGAGTHILKLEAEGAEPEVLDGAKETLKVLHYIAVDCGYERGRDQRHTYIDVNNRLVPIGYRPVAIDFRRGTVLYENYQQ